MNNFCLGLYGTHKSKIEVKKNKKILKFALNNGVKYFDTADVYNNGRQQIFYSNFFGSFRKSINYINKFQLYEDNIKLEQNLNKSLLRMKTDYIDVYMPHWPSKYFNPEKLSEFASKVISQGKVNAFGLSNFNLNLIKKFRKFYKGPLYLQNEINFSNYKFSSELIRYCKKNNIFIFSYGLINNFPKNNSKIDFILNKKKISRYELSLLWIKKIRNIIPIIKTSKIENLKKNINILKKKRKIDLNKINIKNNYKKININLIKKIHSDSGILYNSINEAIKNSYKIYPSPKDIAEEIKKIGHIKPFYVRKINPKNYILLSSQARYWATRIAYGDSLDISVLEVD